MLVSFSVDNKNQTIIGRIALLGTTRIAKPLNDYQSSMPLARVFRWSLWFTVAAVVGLTYFLLVLIWPVCPQFAHFRVVPVGLSVDGRGFDDGDPASPSPAAACLPPDCRSLAFSRASRRSLFRSRRASSFFMLRNLLILSIHGGFIAKELTDQLPPYQSLRYLWVWCRIH